MMMMMNDYGLLMIIYYHFKVYSLPYKLYQYYQQGVPKLESLKLSHSLAEISYEGVFVCLFRLIFTNIKHLNESKCVFIKVMLTFF